MTGSVLVDGERLAAVETHIEHLSNNMDRFERSQESVEEAVVELKIVSQQSLEFNRNTMKLIETMNDKVMPRIVALEAWKNKAAGMIMVAATVVSGLVAFVVPIVSKALGG